MANAEVFDSFFRRADLDRDGRISGGEAVGFFQGSGLPQATLAKIWQFSDQNRAGFLSRQEFINALKLVTVAQTGRDLTPELVKAALNGPAASQIPPPRINTPAPPAAQAPAPAPQGNYGQQFPAQSGHAQQFNSQGAYGQPTQFSSVGGGIPPSSQAQGRFSSVGSMHPGAPTMQHPGAPTMQHPTRPGFSAAGPGVNQARPTLGGLMGTSSLPSGPQFSGGMGLSSGPGLQPSSASGLPRPAAPNSMLYSGASLPSAMSTPGLQAAGTGGLKTGPGSFSSGDLYGQGQAARPTGPVTPSKSKSTSELQGFADAFRADPVGSKALAPTALSAKASGVSQTPALGTGYGTQPMNGPGASPPWPRMNPNDVQRYTRVFSKVDTDHDGKITGEQARQLFLSWQLPKDVLKQVWNLSDQDGDSMLSVREFCTALYLMERFREGRPLPPRLPPGIHLDDPRGPDGQMPGGPRPGYGGPNWQQQGNMQQMGPGSAPGSAPAPIRPTLLTTPAGQQNLQNLTSGGRAPAEPQKDAFGEFNFLNKKKQPDKEASNAMPTPNAMPTSNAAPRGLDSSFNNITTGIESRKLMDHREKSVYYRTKLQEIVLFKSRCDNKLSEISERAAADKREVESLAKKYDEKFKAAAEVNGQLALENAALKDVQEKKMELLDALFKMEHGGDPNALLQKRADHIATDLDKLKKALRERGHLLGVEVKQKIPKEMPFGWMQNLQEKATEWHDWNELVDRDFSAVLDLADETSSTDKPSAAASWGNKEDNPLENGSTHAEAVGNGVPAPSVNGDVDSDKEATPVPSVAAETSTEAPPRTAATDVSSSKPAAVKTGVSSLAPITKPSERYANVTESQELGSDVFNSSTAASSPTSSSDVGRGSFTPDQFAGMGASWGFGMNDDDADSASRASWGLQSNPPSTQASLNISSARGATRFSKSSGSFDMGSPRPSSNDGTSSPSRAFERNGTNHSHDFDSFGAFGNSRDSNNKMSSLFGSPKASSTPSLFGGSPKHSSTPSLFGGSPKHSLFGGSPKHSVTPSLFSGSPKASKQDDDFNSSFMRFDSFGPGSPVAPPKTSGEDRPGSFLNRFDSFNSVQTDRAHGSGFHSDDESDIFSAGPFSAKQSHASDGWKAF